MFLTVNRRIALSCVHAARMSKEEPCTREGKERTLGTIREQFEHRTDATCPLPFLFLPAFLLLA